MEVSKSGSTMMHSKALQRHIKFEDQHDQHTSRTVFSHSHLIENF